MKIIAAADGSALGNPGPAGWGWYVDANHWACGGWPHGTNNMGELMAVLDLLQQTAPLGKPLHVLCDSQYVINSITKWMPGWKRNGWKKKDGKPVLNVDLMKALDAAMQGRDVQFEWVKGHAGHDLNEKADDLANGAARAHQDGRTPNPGPGFSAERQDLAASSRDGADQDPQLAPPLAPPLAASSTPAPTSAAPAETDLFALFDDTNYTGVSAPAPVATPAPATSAPAAAPETPAPATSTPATSAPPANAVEAVIAAERSLLDDAVRADPARVAALLHPEWTEVGRSGRLYTRDEMLAEIAPLPYPFTLEVVSVDQIDANTILLVWRSEASGSVTLRSSVWVRTSDGWVQRYHQGTALPA